jgi:alpha-tubulin suppressor-like RCC1 family protein/uncharacterized protein YjdB
MKKPTRSLASAALALTFALSFAACSGDDDPVAVTGVTVSPTPLTVTVGKTAQVTATVAPANAANKDVTWTSGDETTATVSGTGLNVTVSGVAVGTTTITVASAGDATKKAVCSVTVTPAVTGVSVDPVTLDLVAGGAHGSVTATVLPEGVSPADSGVTWTSDKTDVATVQGNGLSATVTPGAPGTATITARTDDGGFTAACTVTVRPAPDGVTVAPTELKLKPDATGMLTAAVSPTGAGQAVVWASDDTSVATVVGDGIAATVTAVAEGTARITATAAGFPAVFGVCDVAVAVPAFMPPTTFCAGNAHSMGIKADGDLWTWGWNNHGQLGNDTNIDCNSPIHVGDDTDWVSVIGGTHTVALKANGELWAWGDGYNGTLGLGDQTDRLVPTRVGTDSDWAAVRTNGGSTTMAIKRDGGLWVCGDNYYGQLGFGDFGQYQSKRLVPTRLGDDEWFAVSSGGGHTLGIRQDGSLWAWGWNYYSQLGLDDPPNIQDPNDTTNLSVPVPTRVGADSDWAAIAAGYGHSMAIKTDGSLWAWGNNASGELGLGDTTRRNVPTKVGEASDWASVSARDHHTLAIRKDGSLWAWGENWYGQLGLGYGREWVHSTPSRVGEGSDWAAVSAGWGHTLALKSDGGLRAWGTNWHVQLGLGLPIDADPHPDPMLVGTGWRVPAN